MSKIICIDTETGGLNPYDSALCSVTLKVVGEDLIKTIYVKPTKSREYNPDALRVNGLTIEFLKENGVTEHEAADLIEEFVKYNGGFKPVFLAHNIVFDAQFVNILFMRTKKRLFMDMMHYHPMDTMIMMKGLKETGVIDIKSVSLSNSYKYFFGEQFADAHTSEGDVLATEKLYLKIKELLQGLKNG